MPQGLKEGEKVSFRGTYPSSITPDGVFVEIFEEEGRKYVKIASKEWFGIGVRGYYVHNGQISPNYSFREIVTKDKDFERYSQMLGGADN